MKALTSLIELINSAENLVVSSAQKTASIEILKKTNNFEEEQLKILDMQLIDPRFLEMFQTSVQAILTVMPFIKMVNDYMQQQISQTTFKRRFMGYHEILRQKSQKEQLKNFDLDVSQFLDQFKKGE